MRVSYNRNAGLALDVNPVLLVVDAGVLVYNAELLRPAFEVGCKVSQSRV